jgi:hypothetical protein
MPLRTVLNLRLVLQAVRCNIQKPLADIDPGDLRVRLVLFDRPLLVASDPNVPATIRVCETPAAALLTASPKG